jgi:hypothetical protein
MLVVATNPFQWYNQSVDIDIKHNAQILDTITINGLNTWLGVCQLQAPYGCVGDEGDIGVLGPLLTGEIQTPKQPFSLRVLTNIAGFFKFISEKINYFIIGSKKIELNESSKNISVGIENTISEKPTTIAEPKESEESKEETTETKVLKTKEKETQKNEGIQIGGNDIDTDEIGGQNNATSPTGKVIGAGGKIYRKDKIIFILSLIVLITIISVALIKNRHKFLKNKKQKH